MGIPAPGRNLLILHLTVMVWGFTGILGNLISISAIHLVWYRVLIAAASLALYFRFRGYPFAVGRKAFIQFFLTGGLVGLHWVLFFESIKVSTVSVTLVCLSSVTLFTAIIEPLFYKRRTSKTEVFVGLLIVIGIYLIFKFESAYIRAEEDGFYGELVDDPRILKVVALSGGYSREEANERLARNRGVVASFSRALTEGLSAQQGDAEFDAALDASIKSIYEASIA